MKWGVPEDEHVLIDLTTLPSRSKNGAYAQAGHNNKRDFKGQINLLYIFGNQSLRPIFYRLVPGNIRELSAFLLTIKESGIEPCILVMDKGFYSAKNVKYMVENRFRFICPLKRDTKLVSPEERSRLFNKADVHYFEYMGRMIWHVEIKFDKEPEKKIYLYLDDELRIREEKDYLSRVNNLPERYTIERFQKKKHHFGTLALLTNISPKTPEEIYQIYKTRNQIEMMFDGFKGVLEADRTYMQNEETLQGWMFANHIALIAHHHIYRALLDAKRLKKISITSLIERLALVRKAKVNGQWVDTELIKSSAKLFQDIGFPVT
jgi:transposase